MKNNYPLEQLEKTIQYEFKNKEYLMQAVTHSSFANEQKINRRKDYERLEFLGDAVLELVSSEELFFEDKDMNEGRLTRTRATIVCEPSLAACAREISLEQYICLGKGEEATGGRNRDSIISDVLEALIGALYLDGGLQVAKDFIHRVILNDWQDKVMFYDSKTILQEKIQEDNTKVLEYRLVSEEGPDHNKTFTVEAYINDEFYGSGEGKNKKSAEQKAAYEAIKKLNNCKK